MLTYFNSNVHKYNLAYLCIAYYSHNRFVRQLINDSLIAAFLNATSGQPNPTPVEGEVGLSRLKTSRTVHTDACSHSEHLIYRYNIYLMYHFYSIYKYFYLNYITFAYEVKLQNFKPVHPSSECCLTRTHLFHTFYKIKIFMHN